MKNEPVILDANRFLALGDEQLRGLRYFAIGTPA
jgi:hypothetical protein